MAPPNVQPHRRALGRALPLGARDLDALARVSPRDVALARRLWENAAPPHLAGLLDAVVEVAP